MMNCLDWLAAHAPIATATVALIALGVATVSLFNTKALAKKRAAVDFFLKTEMDTALLAAYQKYTDGVKQLKPDTDPSQHTAYQDIRSYLNIHELLAVGINQGIYDEEVCYFFWSEELMSARRKADSVIKHAQKTDHPYTYVDMIKLADKWSARKAAAEKKNPLPTLS